MVMPAICADGRVWNPTDGTLGARKSWRIESCQPATECKSETPFAACTAFRIERLEASLNQAREMAVQEELDAVGRYIEEAQGYLAQIQVLHEEALEEFSRAQGE
jgi:hypothetical protein